MLTPKQQQILGLLATNVFDEYSFSELKRLSGERSHSVLQKALLAFKEEQLAVERSVGATKLYRLNLDNEAVTAYLTLHAMTRLDKSVKLLSNLREEIEKVTLFYSLVIFGSYAMGTQTDDSDLDIAVILPDKKLEHKVKAAINTVGNKSLTELDAHVITSENFLTMLLADYENLGKEIARKHLAVANTGIFYKLIRQGVRRGFHY